MTAGDDGWLTCGAGFLSEALIGTVAVLFVHTALRPVVRRIEMHKRTATDVETYYRLRVICKHPHESVIRMILLRHVGSHAGMSIQGITTEDSDTDRTAVVADIYATERNDRFMEDLVSRISVEPDVTSVSWEKGQG
jgi:putative Mg2+ transporter-C (MgtC) family protein